PLGINASPAAAAALVLTNSRLEKVMPDLSSTAFPRFDLWMMMLSMDTLLARRRTEHRWSDSGDAWCPYSSPVSGTWITRNPMNGPSVSQNRLVGIWGSVSCHAGEGVIRAPHPTSCALFMKDPPQASGSPSSPVHHSAAFPIMSWSPNSFGSSSPTGCVLSKALSQYQATFCRSSSLRGSLRPARQAYSHSASVGMR